MMALAGFLMIGWRRQSGKTDHWFKTGWLSKMLEEKWRTEWLALLTKSYLSAAWAKTRN